MNEIVEQLKLDEGFVPHAYKDHLGYQTLGYGFLIDKARNGQIPRHIAEIWLAYEVERRTWQLMDALPWAKTLCSARQGVLIMMAYQLGVNGVLGFSRTLGHIQSGRYDDAAKEMLNSTWYKVQTPARALRLSEQMRTGQWQDR